MRFGRLDVSIKDYLGRIGPGIIAALSIIYKNDVYEGMCWYTDEYFIIEFPENIESEIGKIEDIEEYDDIVGHLKSVAADYVENATQMKDIFEDDEEEEEVVIEKEEDTETDSPIEDEDTNE